jgi:hypothetical protein
MIHREDAHAHGHIELRRRKPRSCRQAPGSAHISRSDLPSSQMQDVIDPTYLVSTISIVVVHEVMFLLEVAEEVCAGACDGTDHRPDA